jgi:beta-N-acetylhexosaminidase
MPSPVTAYGEMTSLSERKRRAGQRIILGLSGASPTAEERRFIREVMPVGFILFKHNIEEPAQVRELNRELVSLLPSRYPPLLSVDQEGGRVLRVAATRWPPMRWVGNMEHLPTTGQVARAMGDELRAMGFNLNFAPDADVDSNPANPIIGDRAFSRHPDKAAAQVVAYLQGLQDRGVIACAKHFPGHGDTHQDSHKVLPIVEKERPDLERCELRPFQAAIQAGVGMVMTCHVVFPAWDEENPATLSRRIIRGVLRDKLGYQGVVCSDDMEMGALHGRFPLEIQLERATAASVDLFIEGRYFTKTLDLAHRSWEQLVQLQEDDPAQVRLAEDTEKRVKALRERFLKDPPAAADLSVVGCPAFTSLALAVQARGADGVV